MAQFGMLKFELYRARPGILRRSQWRWRLKARNGRIIADSGEGYNNRTDALAAMELIRRRAADAPITEQDERKLV